jgi:uncharacterized protein YjbJ (UPF0337 family)
MRNNELSGEGLSPLSARRDGTGKGDPDALAVGLLPDGFQTESRSMRIVHSAFATVGSMVATLPALAQTTPPAAAADGGMGWIWIVLVLLVIAAAVWYFAFSRRSSTTSASTGIDRDRVEGSAQQAKGSMKEGAGKLMGDTKLQAEGRADQVEGKVQNTVGGVKDTLRGK